MKTEKKRAKGSLRAKWLSKKWEETCPKAHTHENVLAMGGKQVCGHLRVYAPPARTVTVSSETVRSTGLYSPDNLLGGEELGWW